MQPRDHAALLAELERSGILKPGQLEGMTVDFGSDTPASLSAFAQAMIQRQVLTEFQAEELLEGRLADCVIAGRYHLQEKLGQGGMGAVYKARDTQLDRVVAVKVLPAHSLGNADAVARFQREARALARLSHAHIVQAYDSGQDRDRHFLVMEYVDGFSLSAILREQGALPATLAADYIHQAALGLHHAHDKGLIHRDLKPGNLLVSPDRDVEKRGDADSRTPAPMRGLVKILDLGLARFLQDQIGDSQLTQEGIGVGTPDYMAPEQFRDALHADVRTDIYGLGCTLYHLIGGTVPFPGSSFSEKARAHANKEPIPLEERCPEVPAGLAFVVSKMMAKHPSERFQSALEVAEALAPYVAGASHSMILLRQTMRFHRGQLTMRASPRKPLLLWGGLAAAILLVAALAVFAWPYLFPSDGPSQAQATPPPTVSPTAAPTLAPTVPPQPTQPQKPVIETIDNGVTVAKDGRGQFTTIVAALDKIKPGQTIRVLDSANYEETLQITRPGQHAGIAIESPQGATLSFPPKASHGIVIVNVADVRLSGLNIVGETQFGITVGGRCPGVVLERLRIDLNREASHFGVTVEALPLGESDAPVTVRDCHIRNIGRVGLRVSGYDDYTTPSPSRGVRFLNNRIEGCKGGIMLVGQVERVLVAGNLIWDCQLVGIQLENIMKGSRDLLVFNNTILQCGHAIRLWDGRVPSANVEIRNNLLLQSVEPDVVFIDSGGNEENPKGPGDIAALLKFWKLSHNWRETAKPIGADRDSKSWIPPSKDDVAKQPVEGIERKPDHADFLRPAKNSPLATAGIGGDLPAYVGAVAPEGATPWNWQWTWETQFHNLLTVSKLPESGGRFQTIRDALKSARPGMTIRVLDAETYEEALVVTDGTRLAGLTLETPRKAILALNAEADVLLQIADVPRLRISGFRIRRVGGKGLATLIKVTGKCPGLKLQELDIETTDYVYAITCESVRIEANEPPAQIRNCQIRGNKASTASEGINWNCSADGSAPPSRVLICDNRISNIYKGITIRGGVSNVLVAGNITIRCEQTGLELNNLQSSSRNILVANNSSIECGSAFRIWDEKPFDKPEKGAVAIHNNLFVRAIRADLTAIHDPADGTNNYKVADAKQWWDAWTVSHNWRDGSGTLTTFIAPLAAGDRKLDPGDLISRDEANPDFLRPKADSPLAKEGIGGDLPTYVGAVPPKDAPAWDWEKTWKGRGKGK